MVGSGIKNVEPLHSTTRVGLALFLWVWCRS